MKILVLFICLGLSFHLVSQDLPYQKGEIIDSVSVQSSEGESFALYLPKNYDPETENAVLFIFDPGARGTIGIKPFISSAEKYNLILVCSNDSRNTAYEENFAIAERWLNQVFTNFKIDQEHIYAAGFSGGSRLASTIGVLSGLFKAVIGCGAAFSVNPSQAPYSTDHFNYVGIVGELDMNYQEMFRAREWLNRIGLSNQLYTFNGEHRWPDPDLLLISFDWLKLQDYLDGIAPKDEAFLDEYLSTQLLRAQESIKNRQLHLTVQIYEKTLQDLGRDFDLDSISTKVQKLKASKEFKRVQKEANAIADLEKQWTEKLTGRIRSEVEKKRLPKDFKWWAKELGKLDKEYAQSDLLVNRNMGKRLQSMIFAVCIETLELSVANKNVFEVDYYTSLMQANWPDNAFISYRSAKAFASLGQDDRALHNLEQAILKGWDNKQWILHNRAFHHLRNNDKFQELMGQLK